MYNTIKLTRSLGESILFTKADAFRLESNRVLIGECDSLMGDREECERVEFKILDERNGEEFEWTVIVSDIKLSF